MVTISEGSVGDTIHQLQENIQGLIQYHVQCGFQDLMSPIPHQQAQMYFFLAECRIELCADQSHRYAGCCIGNDDFPWCSVMSASSLLQEAGEEELSLPGKSLAEICHGVPCRDGVCVSVPEYLAASLGCGCHAGNL